MKRHLYIGTCFGIAASLALTAAQAQQSTELYIPIGKSPGVSTSQSIIGTISAINHTAYELTIAVEDREAVLIMSPKTMYYLDRNRDKKTNTAGKFDDCELGRRVEVKLDKIGNVEWIKVAAP